jgi:putative Holliday junction resolvase
LGRILGLDFGKKRVGLAVSDPLKITAQPFHVWTGNKPDECIRYIRAVVTDQDIELIVIGYPFTLKNKTSQSTRNVDRFVAMLSMEVTIPILKWDERLTSVAAHRIMHDLGEKPSRNKEKVDLLAATLILENYLDYRHRQSAETGESKI